MKLEALCLGEASSGEPRHVLACEGGGRNQRHDLLKVGDSEADAPELKPLLAGAEEEVGNHCGGQEDLVVDADVEEFHCWLPDLWLSGAGRSPIAICLFLSIYGADA